MNARDRRLYDRQVLVKPLEPGDQVLLKEEGRKGLKSRWRPGFVVVEARENLICVQDLATREEKTLNECEL